MAQVQDSGSSMSLQWKAESFRFTAMFPVGELQVEDWWTNAVGDEPETATTRKGGEKKQEGPFHNGQLRLSVRPERIDWLFSGRYAGPDKEENDSLPILGPVEESLGVFKGIVEKWLGSETCPTAQRIAFGAVLLSPVDSREVGYQQLATYLEGITLDPANSQDFSYQINRPRTSGVGDLDIVVNRLSKWSVAIVQTGGLVLGAGKVTFVGGTQALACRLELDISTDARYGGHLNPTHMKDLLEELISLGLEIASKGDVR